VSEYLNVADVELVGFAGSEEIVGMGAVTVQVSDAAAEGVFDPTWASTAKVFDPALVTVSVTPLEAHELKLAPLSEQRNDTPARVSEYLKLAEVAVVGLAGSEVMVGVGGTMDHV